MTPTEPNDVTEGELGPDELRRENTQVDGTDTAAEPDEGDTASEPATEDTAGEAGEEE